MTILNIGDAMVIFDGIHRLRWLHQPAWPSQLATQEGIPLRVLGHVWPDNSTRTRLRRLIDHHQKVVVVLEHPAPTIELPRARVPQIPDGVVELAGSNSENCLLSIPPFTWLSATHRQRGDEFIARCGVDGLDAVGNRLPALLVEDELLGSREALRFVYQRTPLTIDVLCAAIDRLYRIGLSAALPITQPSRAPEQTQRVPVDHPRAA